jgi:hypothetical protein
VCVRDASLRVFLQVPLTVVSLVCHRVISAAFRDAAGSKFASATRKHFQKVESVSKCSILKQRGGVSVS